VDPSVFLPVTFADIMEEDFRSTYRRMREQTPRPIRFSEDDFGDFYRIEAQ
jgi:hypothetical protein